MLRKTCFKMWRSQRFFSKKSFSMSFCCLQHVDLMLATANRFDFVACYGQQNLLSKILQNNMILLWETLEHFHVICKKHVVALENGTMSPRLYFWCVSMSYRFRFSSLFPKRKENYKESKVIIEIKYVSCICGALRDLVPLVQFK